MVKTMFFAIFVTLLIVVANIIDANPVVIKEVQQEAGVLIGEVNDDTLTDWLTKTTQSDDNDSEMTDDTNNEATNKDVKSTDNSSNLGKKVDEKLGFKKDSKPEEPKMGKSTGSL